MAPPAEPLDTPVLHGRNLGARASRVPAAMETKIDEKSEHQIKKLSNKRLGKQLSSFLFANHHQQQLPLVGGIPFCHLFMPRSHPITILEPPSPCLKLVQEYKQACEALLDAQKLDPGNEEIEKELRKAMELMKICPEEDQQ